jgi:hypothetical protein
MIEISKAAERKARELAEEEISSNPCVLRYITVENVLARILQEHSDVAKEAIGQIDFGNEKYARAELQSLILPEEPDALEECFGAAVEASRSGDKLLDRLREELTKRGLAIVPTTKRADPIIDEAGIGCGAGSVG